MFRDYSSIVLEDCTAEPIGYNLPRSNHEASSLAIQTLLGWVSNSSEFIKARQSSAVNTQSLQLEECHTGNTIYKSKGLVLPHSAMLDSRFEHLMKFTAENPPTSPPPETLSAILKNDRIKK